MSLNGESSGERNHSNDHHSSLYEDHQYLLNNAEIIRTLSHSDRSSADSLLQHLTEKFNKLLEALKSEEFERKKLQ